MVYVVANDGQPLMPTNRYGKVYRMLRSGMAIVVKKCPFTIQLQYESERNVQPVALGIDAGSKHVGVSATTKAKVLYESDVELRGDIVKLLATRRQLRRSRRSRWISGMSESMYSSGMDTPASAAREDPKIRY